MAGKQRQPAAALLTVKQTPPKKARAKKTRAETSQKAPASESVQVSRTPQPAELPMSPQAYADSVWDVLRSQLVDRIRRLAETGSPVPEPADLAALIGAGLPAAPAELDPHYADIGPFYDSAGAMRQLGGVTKQALDSRRSNQTVVAMQTGDGHWLYPAWQFTGNGGIHPVLVPVLKALRGLNRWAAGVWLVSAHPSLDGRSPRQALREQVDPRLVARLALHDKTSLVA
jgi:hypothetical protein